MLDLPNLGAEAHALNVKVCKTPHGIAKTATCSDTGSWHHKTTVVGKTFPGIVYFVLFGPKINNHRRITNCIFETTYETNDRNTHTTISNLTT